MIPLWIRRLPHNLSTIRPAFKMRFDWYYWRLGLFIFFDGAPGDSNYLFHFDACGLGVGLGPLSLWAWLKDTPSKGDA